MRRYIVLALGLLLVSFQVDAQTVNRKAVLSWTAPARCEGSATTGTTNCPILGYSVQRQIAGVWTQIGTTAASVVTYTDQNLALGTYNYRVLATSAAGPSAPSNENSKSFEVPGAPGNLIISVTITIEP